VAGAAVTLLVIGITAEFSIWWSCIVLGALGLVGVLRRLGIR
jgi:hypothetical protein